MADRHPTHQYALDVVEGRILAGKWVRLACERHLRDLERVNTDDFPFVFDEDRADKVFEWYTYCSHVEGELAGQPIILAPFQQFILGSVFGWVHRETGYRRFRKAYVQVARKNAKSTTLSGLGLYMLMGDGEPGAQVYATATKKEQARVVYDAAKVMAEKSPELLKRLEPGVNRIYHRKSNSKFLPLSKDTKSMDGFNPYLGIIDEYHAHPTAEMYGVLISGMGKRKQPLLFIITTAGFDLNSPCFKEYSYLCKVLEGTLENEQYFAYIAQLDGEDSRLDERNWIKANPLLGNDPDAMAFLRNELKEAQEDPDKMRNFLTKNLNDWVDQKPDGYMRMDKWRACYVPKEHFPDLHGLECYIGVDLSATIDLTSVGFEVLLPDGRMAVLSHSFMPQETLAAKRKNDQVPYDAWVADGFITATEGAVVDYRYIMKYIQDQVEARGWVVRELCYDKWNATQFATEMRDLGYNIVEIPQTITYLSEPTKDFRGRVYAKRIIHDGNPVLRWAISNAVTRQDHNQNIMLDKKKARERIDAVAALMNAHVRAMIAAGPVHDVSEFADEDFLDRLWGGE